MADMLTRLEALARPIKVGIIGPGHTGKALIHQCGITPGIDCVAVADIAMQKATDACTALHHRHEVAENHGNLHDVINRGLVGVCEDGELLARCEALDVLIESSSAVAGGGHFAAVALENGIHVVMMNAEADLIFGPYLMHLGEKNGVVYTTCDGDQPGVIQRLVREIQLWGFELVMAGNIKGFLNRYVDPTSIIPEADKRFLDYKRWPLWPTHWAWRQMSLGCTGREHRIFWRSLICSTSIGSTPAARWWSITFWGRSRVAASLSSAGVTMHFSKK